MINFALFTFGFSRSAIFSVGKPMECSGTYGWQLPVNIFLLMATPALMGYLIKKEEKK